MQCAPKGLPYDIDCMAGVASISNFYGVHLRACTK